MKISGSATLNAPREKAFEALNDPGILARTIPGVQSLEQLSEDRYRMSVTAGVASIKGSYDGEVSLGDVDPPHRFTLRARGAGAPGTVDATVRVSLREQDGGTSIEYDADAVVGGMVGGVGQRVLCGVAKKMAGQFFGNVDAVLTGAAPVPEPVGTAAGAESAAAPAPVSTPVPTPVSTPDEGPGVPPAPAPSLTEDLKVPFWIVLAGVGAGAFWALAGVVVGSRIARRG